MVGNSKKQSWQYWFPIALLLSVIGCSSDDAAPSELDGISSKNSELNYNGKSFPMDDGLLLNRKEEGSHYKVDLMMTDGNFIPVEIIVGYFYITHWYFGAETVRLELDLYSPGTDRFRTGTFTFDPIRNQDVEDNTSLDGQYFFNQGEVGVDVDGDGEVDHDTEIFNTIDGTVTVTGEFPVYEVSYELQLDNGTEVSGYFDYDFAVWPVED